MKRRDFFRNSALAAGTALAGPMDLFGKPIVGPRQADRAKNIIFMVSDGMSLGTLTMADELRFRKEGFQSHWMSLYRGGLAKRAVMETASASSLVTDSAAASSSWGGGRRVANGSLNVNADGSFNKPIWQKFKAAGKAVGCVTTVPITHATPAGFCVNSNSRDDQPRIAETYLDLRFDVMMGGGTEFFDGGQRKDKTDLFGKFIERGFDVVRDRDGLLSADPAGIAPLLGVFHGDGLPFALDRDSDPELRRRIPSLAEMTSTALKRLSANSEGFALQVEGGKVDWAAHANDAPALLYDQLAFDDAVAAAIDFADRDGNTLIIITTDHGNANPGLFYGSKADANFDRLQTARHTNHWVLNGITPRSTVAQVIERIEAACGVAIQPEDAGELLKHYRGADEAGLYNPRNLPFRALAGMLERHLSVGWGSMDHSGDFVELAMYGSGSGELMPFVRNFELHDYMLRATGVLTTV
ncbi:alkaline phosphatase [Parapedobacter koreensis]|uniref:Alkaline phosphatase n=1 Tax=Parapedobacter koreensis TaxID=332977 RepID=A0A1H7III3_9SPHI|nr:alkaline phosphatase [Parapedobacter koreensis]SEK60505.1 alkaline phosphatase [Parapedobacter koreensis]